MSSAEDCHGALAWVTLTDSVLLKEKKAFNSNEWYMYICCQVIQRHYKWSPSEPFGELSAMKNEVLWQNENNFPIFSRGINSSWEEFVFSAKITMINCILEIGMNAIFCSVLGYDFVIQTIRLLQHNKQTKKKRKKNLNILDLHALYSRFEIGALC